MDEHLMAIDKDGKLHDLGRLEQTPTLETATDQFDEIAAFISEIRRNAEKISVTFTLDRIKVRKAWTKIFMMPRYRATEFTFPKKKKRGTMRRMRRNKQ